MRTAVSFFAYAIMHVFACENIYQKEGGPDRSVSHNMFSADTFSEPVMKARECEFHSGRRS